MLLVIVGTLIESKIFLKFPIRLLFLEICNVKYRGLKWTVELNVPILPMSLTACI